ncbi:MAG TPA: GDSL-type esterase/lipase family protein [Bacteroidales bacterium]|nr:GDSL-type esterase/lipase family protein [Bacteroidales bacterium]
MKRKLLLLSLSLFSIVACSTSPDELLESDTLPVPQLTDFTPDGSGAEWSDQGLQVQLFADRYGNVPDSNNLAAQFRLGWNKEGICLFMVISDNQFIENSKYPWKDDGLEIFLSAGQGNPDILHYFITPGFDRPDKKPYISVQVQGRHRSTPPVVPEPFIRKTQEGYTMEILFPFPDSTVTPVKGQHFAMQVYVNDTDTTGENLHKQLTWYYMTDTHANPYALQNLTLVGKGKYRVDVASKAYIKDDSVLSGRIMGSNRYADSAFSVYDHQNRLAAGKLIEGKNNLAVADFSLPVDTFPPAYDTLTIMIGDSVISMINPSFLPFVFESKKQSNYFEPEIRLYEAIDRIQPPKKDQILFVGSSSIRMWQTVQQDMYPLEVINRGFGGSNAKDALFYFDRIVKPYQPEAIVYYEGDNDLAQEQTPAEFIANCKLFIEKAHAELPGTPIYLLSVKPSPSRRNLLPATNKANQMLSELADKCTDVSYIDISQAMMEKNGEINPDIFRSDSLHMTYDGYRIWTKIIKPVLMKDFGDQVKKNKK